MSFTNGGRDVRLVAGARAVSWLGDEVALVALMLRLQSHGQRRRRGGGADDRQHAAAGAAVRRRRAAGRPVRQPAAAARVERGAGGGVRGRSPFVSAPAAVLALLAAARRRAGGQLRDLVGAAAGDRRAGGAAQRDRRRPGRRRRWPASSRRRSAACCTARTAPGCRCSSTPRSFLVVLVAGLRRADPAAVVARGQARSSAAGWRSCAPTRCCAPLFVMLALFVLLGAMVNVVDVFLVRGDAGRERDLVRRGRRGVLGRRAGRRASVPGGCAAPCALARGLVGRAVRARARARGDGLRARRCVWLLPIGFVAGAANGVLNVALGVARDGHVPPPTSAGGSARLLERRVQGTQLIAFALGGAAGRARSTRARSSCWPAGCGLLAPVLLGRGGAACGRARPTAADSAVMETVS